MLTPVDVQNKVFKGGIGFDKKDVEAFMEELTSDYSELYRSNVELKDKVTTLDESLQHYRTIEESVQKSLTISEKAAEETINAAKDKARQINIEAEKKAEAIVADAQDELQRLQEEIFRLQNQHKQFVAQFKKVLNAQLQLCDGKVVDIDLGEGFDSSRYSDSGYSSFGSEGGLGGGGGYTGSSSFDDGRERAAGEPTSNVGSLNIDPFSDSKNGGRFSSKTTQKSSQKTTFSMSNDNGKGGLNMKAGQPANVKIKRNIPNAAASDGVNSDFEFKEASKKKPGKNEAPKKESVKKESAKKEQAAVNQQAKEAEQNLQAQKAAEEAERLAAEQAVREAARLEAERKAAQEAALREKEKAEEAAKNEQIAKEHLDKELESTINAVKEAAKKQETKPEKEDPYANQSINYYAMQQAKEKAAAKEAAASVAEPVADTDSNTEDSAFSGEVESKVDESTMLDSEDNYSTGFDFISDDDTDSSSVDSLSFEEDDDSAFVGEVENKVDESTMLDSEDNYSTGFDFISDTDEDASTTSSDSLSFEEDDDTAFVGEVEDKVNESTMLDSEDNYSDGFDFLVEEEPSEEIPVINQGLNSNFSFSIRGADEDTEDDGALVGDVEENVKQSNLIGNDDDEDEGFNFL